jgi:hypothetical protein
MTRVFNSLVGIALAAAIAIVASALTFQTNPLSPPFWVGVLVLPIATLAIAAINKVLPPHIVWLPLRVQVILLKEGSNKLRIFQVVRMVATFSACVAILEGAHHIFGGGHQLSVGVVAAGLFFSAQPFTASWVRILTKRHG